MSMSRDGRDEAKSVLESHNVLENSHSVHVDSLRKVCPHTQNQTISQSHQQAQIASLPLQQSSVITLLLLMLNKRSRYDCRMPA